MTGDLHFRAPSWDSQVVLPVTGSGTVFAYQIDDDGGTWVQVRFDFDAPVAEPVP